MEGENANQIDKSKAVYSKYRLLDSETGEEKTGKYFVLKIDAADPDERKAVFDALFEYARAHAKNGNREYAMNVLGFITA